MTKINLLFLIGFMLVAPFAAYAQEEGTSADLLLPPALITPDAPFYRGARVKLGNDIMPVVEGKLPGGTLAQYQPERNVVIVSDASDISENRKGQALMDVVSAMDVSTVETAAGQASDVEPSAGVEK